MVRASFDTETGAVKREIRSADSLQRGRWYDFALPPHGRRMAIGGVVSEQKGTVEIWDFLDHSAAAGTDGDSRISPQPIDTEIRKNPDGKVSFNINGQPWEAVLRWLADASALSLDWQELPGDPLDLITTREYTMQEARDLINLHLISRGFTMIVTGEVMLIVKVKELKPERFSE
jgi:hypothetical protein